MIFSALSIVSPAGNKIASKEKTIEIRKWKPSIVPLENLLIIQNKNYLSDKLPEDNNGKAVALVDVYEITLWEERHFKQSCASSFEEGYFAWHLTNIRKVTCSLPLTAKRKIYTLEAKLKITNE
jgi:hypothetical protein